MGCVLTRHLLKVLLLLVLGLLTASAGVGLTPVAAQPTYPEPLGFVSDFAELLSPEVRSQLEAELAQLEQDTGIEIAVVTVPDLGGTTVEDYAVLLFEQWGIGKKGEDNGVLLLVAQDDRKLRIEVGYGLEPLLTDARAGAIIREQITPRFQDGDYDAGITAGVAQIKAAVLGEAQPSDPLADNPVQRYLGDLILPLLIVAGVTIYLAGYMARSRSIWLGGIWGGVVGLFGGLLLGTLVGLAVVTVLGSGLGLLLDFVLSRNYKVRRSSGRRTDWFGSWGGFGGSGGGWWSGGGGGGFGGFGGGGSGGGGASGGW